MITVPVLYSQLDAVGVASQLQELGAWGLLIGLVIAVLRWLLRRLEKLEVELRDAQAEQRRLERQIADERAESARALLEIATRAQDQSVALQWARGRDSCDRR